MIVKAKYQEYTPEHRPHYYPIDSWVDNFRVGKVEDPTEEEKEVLKEIESTKDNVKKGVGNFILNMFKKKEK